MLLINWLHNLKDFTGYIEKWSKERQKYDLKFLPFYDVNEKFQSRNFLNYIIFNFSSLEFLVGKIQSVGISIKTFCYPIFIHTLGTSVNDILYAWLVYSIIKIFTDWFMGFGVLLL